MSLGFRVLAEADREVDHAAGHYEMETPGTGRRFLRAYFELIAQVQQFPKTGSRLVEYELPGLEVRSFVVSTVFPYTAYVAVLSNEIVLLAVAHQHQEPGYWAKRLDEIGP